MIAGEDTTLRFTIENNSEFRARTVSLEVTLPSAFDLVSSDPEGTLEGVILTIPVGLINPNTTQTVDVVVNCPDVGVFQVFATVSEANPETAPEDNETSQIFNLNSLCEVVDIVNGGGTTFDCYADGDYSSAMLVSGTSFTSIEVGDSPFGFAFGDEFTDYADGSYSGGTPGNSVTGFTQIHVGNGP